MKKLLISLSFLFYCVIISKAQGHSTCSRAVLMDTNVYGPVYADGVPYPTLAMQHTDGNYFEKPHTAVWFCIDIPYDTILTFDLLPKNPTDDLDFLLFKDETAEIKNCSMCRVDKKNFCQRIAVEKMVPVRANIAKNGGNKGMTGLSENVMDEVEPPGDHPAYSSALRVKKGERYYLVVDNYTHAQGAFTLKLHFHFPPDSLQNEAVSKPVNKTISPKGFAFMVMDSITGKPVKARLHADWDTLVHKRNIDTTTSVCPVKIAKGEKVNITCYAKGYLIYFKSYIAQTDTDKKFAIQLLPIKEHMKMIFKHLEFEPGEATFLPEADESLSALLDFMTNNPDVKILIKGYVNDPNSAYSQDFDIELSTKRAQAVYNYLVQNGVKQYRLKWHGYGNSEMVYPHPDNEDEMEMNRRVEVEIIK